MRRILLVPLRLIGGALRAILVGVLAVAMIAGGVAFADYTVTQGVGTTFASVVLGGTKHYLAMMLCDMTAGESQCAAVNASGQVAINLGAVGGTNIATGCAGALSGFSATIPATICGIYGTYVLNATSPGAAAPGASSPTVLPILPHASVSSLGTSLVAKAGPGNLNSFNCTAIAGATAGYCIAYNGTTAPSTGALTGTLVLDSCYFDTTARGCSLAHINGSVAFSTGIVILMTSATTPFTYTTGTDTGFIEADTN